MATKILWYLSPYDGFTPWVQETRTPGSVEHIAELAAHLDTLPFYGALQGTYAQDSFLTIAQIAHRTRRLRFLVPFYPALTAPKLLAEQVLTFDQFTGGRLILNLVNGIDAKIQTYGFPVPHDQRYDISAEYWELFTAAYEGRDVDYAGTYLDREIYAKAFDHAFEPTSYFPFRQGSAEPIPPIQAPHAPLWGAGASEAGQDFAGRIVEVYLAHLRESDALKAQFDGGEARAAAHGRRFEAEGVHGSVIVRERDEDALDYFYSQIEATGVEHTRSRLEARLKASSGGRLELSTFTAPDPVRRRIVDRLLAGKLPTPAELELEPGVYAGLTPWGAFDINAEGTAVYLVGSGDAVQRSIERIQAKTPLVDRFILSAWPLAQEASTVAEILLPRLGAERPEAVAA
ncbi:MAG: LLM class flavin-dependent oxidoreductase [Microbacterium sp.]|uniref:LLM class flavin-dependent oxidoreductase n=1 Tax=Microbacterium sp. TaxID=51671 RepID=UPI0039E2FEB2